MSQPTRTDQGAVAGDGAAPGSVLRVDDLHVTFRTAGHVVHAVAGVSVEVNRGEVVGVVGESGSGKSTLGLAACALTKVSSGSISVAGHTLTALRGRALRRARADIQMVFQDPHGSLDPRQRVGKGFAELRALHRDRDLEPSDEALLAQVGLPLGIAHRLPHQLSGGQAQRVSIARAILLRPKVLIADEPTSGLDVSVQAQILDLIRELSSTQDVSVLFISHDLAVVRQLCERAYVMRRGEIVEQGRTADVFERPQHEYTRDLVNAVPGKALHRVGVAS